jgi:hypothetical protein
MQGRGAAGEMQGRGAAGREDAREGCAWAAGEMQGRGLNGEEKKYFGYICKINSAGI